MSESVNIASLSLQQLAEIRKQLEAEVNHLSQSSVEIKQTLGKFLDCSQSVKATVKNTNASGELMVPLTSSLYVPGRVSESNKFIVNVGTNYFVEKNGDETMQFFEQKIDVLNKNLVDLDKLLNEKVMTLKNMDMIYKEKFREALDKADKEGKK